MREAWFIGADTHTVLGRSLADNIAALSTPPAPQQIELRFGGQTIVIPYLILADQPLEDIERRLYQVLYAVIGQALDEAAKSGMTAAQRRRMGLFLGTSSADVSVSEARFLRELETSPDATALIGSNSISNLARHLRHHFGLGGPDYSFNTACTASANALMSAVDMVSSGDLDHALVVGVELCNVITATGFQGLGLFASQTMQPFDQDRNGLILGEGCSALVISASAPKAEGQLGRFHLRGSANLCDTYSMSAANPDGSTVAAVMNQALARAGLEASQLGAIKTHGTASLHNDESEMAGMRQVFDTLPPVCALKPYIGHTLGACGLNELLLFCGAAQAGFLPGTPGIASPERADLGVSLNQSRLPLAPGHFMLNFFGFGGNNTSLILSNTE